MTISGIITAIVFGALIGALGRLVVPGRQNMPIWLTILVGIGAAFLGTGVAHWVGLTTHGWNLWETIFQIIIAAILVWLVATLWPRRGAGPAA